MFPFDGKVNSVGWSNAFGSFLSLSGSLRGSADFVFFVSSLLGLRLGMSLSRTRWSESFLERSMGDGLLDLRMGAWFRSKSSSDDDSKSHRDLSVEIFWGSVEVLAFLFRSRGGKGSFAAVRTGLRELSLSLSHDSLDREPLDDLEQLVDLEEDTDLVRFLPLNGLLSNSLSDSEE